MDEPARRPVGEGHRRRPILLLLLAILAWSALAAWGAAWFNQDFRKALIVLGCSLAFVLSWWILLLRAPRHREEPMTPPEHAPLPATPVAWNFASLASLTVAVAALAAALVTARLPRLYPSAVWLWAPLMLALLSALLALIGLSDPARRKGRSAGLLALVLGLVALAVSVVLP